MEITVVWPMRLFYYPLIRFGGRLTGREETAEQLIDVAEENIERTLETLEA
jgi:ABC-type Fe3+-hydroxamate transport system substrate-binding protein